MSICPGTENDRRWPEPGEVVTFTAHVVNKGNTASPAFGYAWHIDGAEVARGTLPALAPAAEATATYRWPWGHGLSADGQRALGEHTVRFTADPDDAIAETYESNNSLEDRPNAMSFSIYLPPDVYEAYNHPVDPKYPYSAEDWLQKQIAAMNAGFANSTYPVTPQGMALRVRIDTIGVTDANGIFVLPNRSANGGTVTANGHVMHDNPFGVVDIIGNQGLLLVKLARSGHEEFHWLDITQFNQAY